MNERGWDHSVVGGWRAWASALACVLLLLTTGAAGAAPPVVAPTADDAVIDLAQHVEVLVDETRALDIDTVRAGPPGAFAAPETRSGDINFGYRRADVWLRFAVRLPPGSERRQRWLLEVAHPPLDRVELYLGGASEPMVAGDHLRFEDRPVQHRNLVFPLELTAGSTHPVLIHVRSEGSLTIPLRLWRADAFERHNQLSYSVLAAYYGALVALLLYNLLLFVSTVDRSYLEYSLIIVGMAVGQLSLNGLGAQFLWPDLPVWGDLALPAGFAFCCLFAALFTRSFLGTKTMVPSLDTVLLAFAFMFGANLAALAAVPYQYVAMSIALLGPLFALVAMVSGVRCYLRRVPGSGIYLLAWTMVLAGGAILGARHYGWVPTNFFTRYAMQIGSAVEILLLSFALADRINSLRRERDHAQHEALRAQRSIVATLQETEHQLEERVALRTRELEAANARLVDSEQQLQHLVSHDPLTGLANRLLLDDRIGHGIERAARHHTGMALLVVDLDGFKPINDNHGHAIGDDVLVEVAARLRRIVRSEDTVARLGGDEFVIVLESTFDRRDAQRVASAIEKELATPFELAGRTVSIGASVGCAMYPEDGKDGMALLKWADQMMYRSKNERRPRAVAFQGSSASPP